MSDFLLNLGGNKAARSVMNTVGIPVPPQLRRGTGPWSERPLQGRTVHLNEGPLTEQIRSLVSELGGLLGPDAAPNALVFDATSFSAAADLRQLYEHFHPSIRGLTRSGRVVVLGRHPSTVEGAEAAATHTALDGFVRSLAKEIGRKGSTANLVYVDADAEDRLAPVLRWLLSDRSVYVDGQPLHVTATCSGELPDWSPRSFHGKTVLVTGAARGIGRATAMRLALEGARVAVLDRPEEQEALDALANEIGGLAIAADITADDAPTLIADALPDGVYSIIHNAGVTRDKTLGRMDEGQWDLLMAVNLGAILRIHEAMVDTIEGRIVLLSSIAGLAGNPGQTNYGASKAAVAGLARAWGPELAERGVGVMAVAPGFIETRMTAAIPFGTREAGRRLCNLSQGGLPADVAEVLTFLASPHALGLTGDVLRVCGGSLIGR